MTYWFYDLAKCLLRIFFGVGFGLEVQGRGHVPRSGAFILASNHVSYLDPPVIGAACPRRLRFMARADLFQHRFLGVLLRGLCVMPLQREEGDLEAIRGAVNRLRQGEAVAIFPEGGRQISGKLSSAKRGVGLLATKAHVPVVPVLVKGTFDALPPHARRLHRAKIRVAFGPSISYTESPRLSSERSGQEGVRRHHERLAETLTQEWRRLEAQLTSE